MTININLYDSRQAKEQIAEVLELLRDKEDVETRELLFLILKKLDKMTTQQDQIKADLDALVQSGQDLADAQAQEATNLATLKTEVDQIKADEASGADQSTTVTALDALSAKLATAASNAKANAAALGDFVNTLAAPPAQTGTGTGSAPAPTTTDHSFSDANGDTIVVSQAGDVPAAGDKVLVNGAAPVLGSYTLSDGSVLNVGTDGNVTSFVPVAGQ